MARPTVSYVLVIALIACLSRVQAQEPGTLEDDKPETIPVTPSNAADSSPAPPNTVAPINTVRPDPLKGQSNEGTQSATLLWIASVLGLAVALTVIRLALLRSRRR